MAEHERRLRFLDLGVIDLRQVPLAFLHAFFESLAVTDDARLEHLAQQVVALASTFADAREHRKAVVSFGDVVDQLHDQHGLADARPAEQADLSSLGVRLQQVDHLDSGVKHLLHRRQFVELRRLAVNGVGALSVERLHAVDRLAHDVHQAALDLLAHGHRDRPEIRDGLHTAAQPVGTVHRHGTNRILADVLLHLDDQRPAVVAADVHRVMDARQHDLVLRSLERHVHDRADDLRDMSRDFTTAGSACYFFRFHTLYPV